MSNTIQNKPGGTNKSNGNGKNGANRPASDQRPTTPTTVVRPQSSATANGTNGVTARPRPNGLRPQPKKTGFKLRPLDIGLIVLGVLIVAIVAYSVISGANKGTTTAGSTVSGNGQVVTVPGPDGTSSMQVLAAGSQAPVFTLPGDDGNTYNLASMKGKTVLLEFMAPWCPHCQADAPEFAKIYNDLKSNPNFAMYGINATPYDQNHSGLISMADMTWFRDKYQVPYPLLFDKAVQDQIPPVATAYQINYYPTLYIIKPDGTVANYMMADQSGALTEDRVTTEVKKYLK